MVPERFSSANSRMVSTGASVSVVIQKKRLSNNSRMTDTPGAPWASTLASSQKLKPMMIRKKIIMT